MRLLQASRSVLKSADPLIDGIDFWMNENAVSHANYGQVANLGGDKG